MDTFPKQPADVLDFDADYTDFLSSSGSDTLQSATVVADTGITVASFSVAAKVVKVWLSGGVTGTTYKITVTAVTVGGRTKEHEFKVKVKEL